MFDSPIISSAAIAGVNVQIELPSVDYTLSAGGKQTMVSEVVTP